MWKTPLALLNKRTQTQKTSALFRFSEERDLIISEVSRRVYKEYLSMARQREDAALEYVLNDAAFKELSRLANEQGPEEEIRSRGWWLRMSKSLSETSEQSRRETLKALIDAYTEDIAGQFNPSVYQLATRALPVGLGVLFKAQDLQDLPGALPQADQILKQLRNLDDRLVFQGEIDTLQELSEKGTLLFVPTHSSNMDSILLGYSLYATGLPPVTYGAGKNLFSNPMTSFFMHNLGAYKVDRRIRHGLYMNILKTYSQVLLERGYHSLFFPGGTRCRSNVVEQRLKLGLLGTSVQAYTRALIQKRKEHKIFICPITINYNLVLEAESLIRDHLRQEGGSRYFLEQDEFDQLSTIARFVMNTMRMDSTTILRFGQPMDPFGNRVELDAQSYDTHGRRVDPVDYVRSARTGEVCEDIYRDREYTAYAGAQIAKQFKRNTVIMPTQLVSHVLLAFVRERFPHWDMYRLLRMGGEEVISWEDLRQGCAALIEELKKLEQQDKLFLAPMIKSERPAKIAEEGIDYLRMFHIPEAVDFHPEGIRLDRLDLLHFYANRLAGYGIDDKKWLRASRKI